MRLLTVKEVSERLRISLSMAYRIIARGELACYEIGASKRVGEDQLEDYLERNRKEVLKAPRGVGRHF